MRYVAGRVTALTGDGNILHTAILDSGASIAADIFVNAAGAWADEVAALAGMRLPIVPMGRVKHYWDAPGELESLPLIKDESGLFFRRQGAGFVGGRPSFDIEPGFAFGPQRAHLERYFAGYFTRIIHSLLTIRMPAFAAVTCTQSWTGHYAQNTFDGNMFLGPWLDGATNFYVACGFSGHGVMHAPAAGMALAELILDGEFSTIDLSRMSVQRLIDDAPYPE